MKRSLLVTALLVFLIGSFVSAAEFGDLPPDHWAYDAVKKLTEAGIIVPFPDGEFKGDTLLTRYDVALYLDRAIQYLVQNVEYMNQRQVMVVTEVLRDMLEEFRRELIMLSLDIRDLELKLDRVRRVSMWKFNLGSEAYVELVRRHENVLGVKKEEKATRFGLVFEPSLTGETERYSVSMWAKGFIFRSSSSSDLAFELEQFRLSVTDNESLTVQLGTLELQPYNDYLFANLEEDDLDINIAGIQIVADNDWPVFNDGVQLNYVSYDDPLGHNEVVLARFGHTIDNVNIGVYAGLKVDNLKKENTLLGVDVAYHLDPLEVEVGFATENFEDVHQRLYLGYDLTKNLHASLQYTNTSLGFTGVYSNLDYGRYLTAKLDFDVNDKTTLYTELKSPLPFEGEQVAYELGLSSKSISLANAGTLDGTVYYNSNKGPGADVTLKFDEHNILRLYGNVPRDEYAVREVGVEGKSRVGRFEVEAGYEQNVTGPVRNRTMKAGVGYLLNEDATLRLTWKKDYLEAPGIKNQETITGLSFHFAF